MIINNKSNILSTERILPYLTKKVDIQIYDTLESTNTTAKELIQAGDISHGTTIIADGLTNARGRRGKSFFAPKGAGIYMSIILNPAQLALDSPELITIFAAVAVCEAIEATCSKSPQVKWINDLFLNDRKVCGILTEAVTNPINGELQAIILGIGINFAASNDLPEELRGIVGAIFPDSNPTTTRNQLIVEVANRILAPRNWTEIIEKYRQRLWMLGREVRVESSDEPYMATALNIDDRGRLLVCDSAGKIHTLDAGEVSVKP